MKFAKSFKLFSTFVTAMVLMFAIAMPAAAATFNDVPDNAWYAQAVDYCQNHGLMTGTSDTEFSPEDTMTRAMLATALYRQSGSLEISGTDNFVDTQNDTWYSNAVIWAYQQKIVNGYSDTVFGTDNPITREEIVTILWRMAGSPAVTENADFSDYSSISPYAVSAVNWAKSQNLINGKEGNRFDPKGNATRAEVAQILSNNTDTKEPDDSQTPDTTPSHRPGSGSSSSGSSGSGSGPDVTDKKPADVSHITSTAGVPLITLNNGVQVPQLGLGTQIQRLENDSSANGRKLLNDTSHDAVVAALRAGYRHLDTAHGYYNETGVGQGIIDSGVPREEIWVTSKLWPSEYGEGVTMQAIDDMLDRLQLDYLDCIYLHHPAGDYMGAWKDLEKAYKQGKVRALGISNFDNWPAAFNAVIESSEIKPQILQIECHPFAQRLETRELAKQYGIQIECWYPLGHADDRLLNNDVLSQIAQAHNKSVVQIILRWHMQEGLCAVPGSTNPSHIQENIDIFDFELSDTEMEQIRAMNRGEAGRYFNINYEQMGGFFTRPLQP